MKYLCLIYDDEKRWAGGYDPVEMQAYRAFGEKHRAAIEGGHALQPSSAATSVRLRDGQRLITDGPFAETKEQLSGYYLVEASDLDGALAIAGEIPAAKFGTIEVRPIITFA